jgi:hypothetical protein
MRTLPPAAQLMHCCRPLQSACSTSAPAHSTAKKTETCHVPDTHECTRSPSRCKRQAHATQLGQLTHSGPLTLARQAYRQGPRCSSPRYCSPAGASHVFASNTAPLGTGSTTAQHNSSARWAQGGRAAPPAEPRSASAQPGCPPTRARRTSAAPATDTNQLPQNGPPGPGSTAKHTAQLTAEHTAEHTSLDIPENPPTNKPGHLT